MTLHATPLSLGWQRLGDSDRTIPEKIESICDTNDNEKNRNHRVWDVQMQGRMREDK